MRNGRRFFAIREQPSTLKHGWWDMESIVNGVIPNASGGDPLIVIPSTSNWSIVAGGVSGNRLQKTSQVASAYVYGDGPLFKFSAEESLTFWGWLWPDSTDINSDGFSKPLLGPQAWSAVDSGLNITAYFTNVSIGMTNARNGSSVSLANVSVIGSIGAQNLFIMRYDHSSRKIAASRNGAGFAESTGTLPTFPWVETLSRFNLGSYIRKNAPNPDVTTPDNRNMLGKWDSVGWLRGKALTSADASWLYNSGAGRTYQDAVDFGLFRN